MFANSLLGQGRSPLPASRPARGLHQGEMAELDGLLSALEERANNLTRLPYELGENIQVVRYKVGQKYGAHRDFFNPNDYHRQPSMLRSVEYGARNRLATVFWYLETVHEGGETFSPPPPSQA